MAGETPITLIGNLTADPELRFTPNGAAVANFTVASTPRTFDRQTNEWKDGDAMFLNCSVWRQYAENVAESLTKGMRVIVSGRLKSRSYETREGERRQLGGGEGDLRQLEAPPVDPVALLVFEEDVVASCLDADADRPEFLLVALELALEGLIGAVTVGLDHAAQLRACEVAAGAEQRDEQIDQPLRLPS